MDTEALQFLADLEAEEVAQISINEVLVPQGERRCPLCQQKMQVEVEEGVSVDVCQQHGVWLDRGELGNMIARIRSGEIGNRRMAVRKARKEGKLSGIMFGTWSLMFD